MKPFTGIAISYNKVPTRIQDIIKSKFIFNHPNCISYSISSTDSIIYYKSSIHAAKALLQLKSSLGSHCLITDDYACDGLDNRVLTIKIHKNHQNIINILYQTKGKIISKSKKTIVVKFPSFFKTARAIRILKKSKIRVKFTPKQYAKFLINMLKYN